MTLSSILFILLLIFGSGLFFTNIRRLIRAILMGKPAGKIQNKSQRIKNMIRFAFGQSKMFSRPVSGILHAFVYVGFFVINIELLEIVIDGAFGTHRVFSSTNSSFYGVLIASFEVLALLVIVSVIVFWVRRNVIKLSRFEKIEMKGWAKNDANIILYIEFVLMLSFLSMNVFDKALQVRGVEGYVSAGLFPVSGLFLNFLDHLSTGTLIFLERSFWWLHIIGIIAFLNYLYYSKHLHVILAFPNTFYASLHPRGSFPVMPSVKKEVRTILGFPEEEVFSEIVTAEKFGASDVEDFTRVQLMSAYSCTECGRCTDECPANKTGKKLSPRRIMMKVRDRLEDVIRKKSKEKKLLGDYISEEELWACTTCNACVEACPLDINPLSIILNMRQYLVMEKSLASVELNKMMSNIENNDSPWAYNNGDRLNWNNQ